MDHEPEHFETVALSPPTFIGLMLAFFAVFAQQAFELHGNVQVRRGPGLVAEITAIERPAYIEYAYVDAAGRRRLSKFYFKHFPADPGVVGQRTRIWELRFFGMERPTPERVIGAGRLDRWGITHSVLMCAFFGLLLFVFLRDQWRRLRLRADGTSDDDARGA